MADEGALLEETEREIPGIKDLQSFSQQALRVLVGSTQKANALPAPGEDHDFYYSFSDFREFRKAQGTRLLSSTHDLLRQFHVRCGWPKRGQSCDSVDVDDLFDNLVEANDIILEEVDTKLDEASGLSKNKKPIMNPSMQPGKAVVSSWNRRKLDSQGKNSPVRLLLAKNILRPQMKFRDKVDNTNTPFIPIIKHKPNALETLKVYTPASTQPEDKSVPLAIADFIHQQRVGSDNSTNRICHPYEYELQLFEPPENQIKEEKEKLYSSLEETPYTYVNTVEELEELSQTLTQVTEFAVDLEHHSYRSFQGFVCLMQISTREQDYLVDTIELRSEMSILNESFTNPKILKVFHGADMDICWLQRDFGVYVVNMFDTGQAARVLTFERFSLSHLLKTFCSITADKQYQLADWRIRPLPAQMVHYAREDTHYLLYIYDRLRNELIRSGNAQNNLLLSVYERSKAVCLKKYEKQLFTSESHLNLYKKQRRPLNPTKLQALRALYEWRDTIARMEDESCGYILPNHMLFNLAESLPREPQGVLACCNPVPPLVKQYVNEVHQIIQNAKDSLETATDGSSVSRPDQETPMDTMSPSAVTKTVHVHSKTTSKKDDRVQINGGHPNISVKAEPFVITVPAGPLVRTVKPVISLFDYQQTNQSTTTTKGQKKAKQIMAGFANPFQMVLPESVVVGDNNRPEQSQASVDKINQKWKKTVTDEIPVTEVSPTKRSGSENESEPEELTPLRQKIDSKKKRKRTKKNTTQEQESPSSPKKTKTDNDEDDDRNSSYENISKKSKEFVPFDYSPAEYSKLEGNQGKQTTGVFDPYEQSKKQKKSSASRSKVHMKSGERSMTYSNNRASQNKQQWPSR